MSLSLPQTHSNSTKAFGSDISDAMKQIIGKVGKKKNINGSVAMALEEQSYLVQLMLETKRDTGGVELCQTVLENFRRTLRSYTVQMEHVMGMNHVKSSDERFMVIMTKQRTLEIEIKYLESKIDLMQRRNRVFDEFAERLSTLYNTGWPRIPSVPPQSVFERNIEEIYRELHKSEMSLERYTFLHTILSQGLKALDAAESYMNRFRNSQDINLLKATRLCTIQADVVIKQAKFVLPYLLNNQLNVVIFQDGWLSTIFRSDKLEDTLGMMNFLSAQHAALVPFIDEAHHLVESQTEAVKRLREKYHNAILDKENAQRKLLYDTIRGENAEGIQEVLSLTYDMLSGLDEVIAYDRNNNNDNDNNNNDMAASVLGNDNNMEAFPINDDADPSQGNLIGPNEISRTSSIDSANTGTTAEMALDGSSDNDSMAIPRPSLEDSLFLRPELNSGPGSRSLSPSSNLNRYNISPSRSPSPSSMPRQQDEMTQTRLQSSVSVSTPRGRASPAPPRPRRAPTLDIDDVYGGVSSAAPAPALPVQRVLSSTDRLQISTLKPFSHHSPSTSVSDTSSQSHQQQPDSRRIDFFRSTSGRSPLENNNNNRVPSPLPSAPYHQPSSRPLPSYQNDTNNIGLSPQPGPGHSPRPSLSQQQQPSQPTSRTLPVPRQLQRTLPIPPSSRSPVPSPTSYSAPAPQPQSQPRSPPAQPTQPDARLPQSQQPGLSSAPPTLGGGGGGGTSSSSSSSSRIPPPPLSAPVPSSLSSPPPALPPKSGRLDSLDEQQKQQQQQRSSQQSQFQDTPTTQSAPAASPRQSHFSPTSAVTPTSGITKSPTHGIMKPTTAAVSRPVPAKQSSLDEWGGVRVGAASAPKTKFRAIFDKLRGESAGSKRAGAGAGSTNDGWHHTVTSATNAATAASASTSIPTPSKPARPSPHFVDEVEYIPRPESDSYPLSDDEEEDIEQPPSPSKRRNSLLMSPTTDEDADEEEEGAGMDLDDYYSNDYSPVQKQSSADGVPPHPGFPSLRESVTASPSDNPKLYMDEMFNPVTSSQDKTKRSQPPPLVQPKPRTVNTSNPLLSRNWQSPTAIISRDLTFS